jgi:pimeloyl-ACP methyl ester carboxylesterase
MTHDGTELRVRSGDVGLCVRVHSPSGPAKPTVVLVHGYPDDQTVWDSVVAELPRADLHVVTYDVRGAGRSDVPGQVADYRTDRLVDDLVAVLDAVAPDGEPVHLAGHDWGSVQLWDAVAAAESDQRLHGRIASFTSISGPSLDHVAWLSRHREHRKARLLRQSLHSWYVYAFQVPVLPEIVWRRGHRLLAALVTAREGRRAAHWGPELSDNAVHGLNLYRANMLGRVSRPGRLRTGVPVLVVHPRRDAFLTAVTLEDLDVHCSDVRVVEVDAGHWVIRTDPELVAGLVAGHVEAHAR